MLEHTKMVLTSVSFEAKLFHKELRKALNWLQPNEIKELKLWCYHNFQSKFEDILLDVFSLKPSI